MSKRKDVKKVVLAYSGGLDTSIILKWLQTELGAGVITFTADLGQGGVLEPARRNGESLRKPSPICRAASPAGTATMIARPPRPCRWPPISMRWRKTSTGS